MSVNCTLVLKTFMLVPFWPVKTETPGEWQDLIAVLRHQNNLVDIAFDHLMSRSVVPSVSPKQETGQTP